MSATPVPLAERIQNLKSRPLGLRRSVKDSRPAQKPPKAEFLVHSCFDQQQEPKPNHCSCDEHIGFVTARTLIESGRAQWLLYKRQDKWLQNRKVLVLTEAGRKCRDAVTHKAPLSTATFQEYNFASIKMESGVDRRTEALRLREIQDRIDEVESVRQHRVTPQGTGPATERGDDE